MSSSSMSNPDKKKMDDVTKCQITFSKRRSSLIRKANEISVFCDVDVAVVTFSPSGRVSKFCSRERIEDVLERYVNLPADKRYPHVRCLEWKLQKLKQLNYIKGDENKLLHIENQIKNLELQINKTTIELEILQTNIKDFEVENEEEASLTQILWCEKNLKNTLQLIKDKKNGLLDETNSSLRQTRPQPQIPQGQTPFPHNLTGYQWPNRARQQNLTLSCQSLMQHDPRTCPYSSMVHDDLLDPLQQARGISFGTPGASSSRYAFNTLAAGNFPPIYHPGQPSFTQLAAIRPTYQPTQHQPFYWGQTAPTLSYQNLQLGVFGNSSMHQQIMGNPPIPYIPYQPALGALGTSNLYQPMMPGILNQQLGVLGGSYVPLMRENHITHGIPNQQPGAFGGSFLNQSLNRDGITPSLQFQAQQTGVLGSSSMGMPANVGPSGTQGNTIPTSYPNHNNSNTTNVASLPPMSQLQGNHNIGNLLCNNTRNLDVITPLNPESSRDGHNINNGIGTSNGNPIYIPSDNNKDRNTSSCDNNIIGNCNTTDKDPAGDNQGTQRPESPSDSMFLNSLLNDQPAMENDTQHATGNQEEHLMEWDGFSSDENFNLDDIDFLL